MDGEASSAKPKPNPRPVRPRRAPTTPDPIEIAMDAEAGGGAPEGIAHKVLVRQERLIRWQTASERMGVGLKALTGLAGLAAAVGLGFMALEASRAQGVQIEPFTVPAAMAESGLTGEAVAAQVLDQLAVLEQEARGSQGVSFASARGNEVRVAIPATGISLGDLQTALKHWLGSERRVTGELFRTPSGLALRGRTAGGGGFAASGGDGELDALTRQAALAIVRDTRPGTYAALLVQKGDLDGAYAILRNAAENGRTPAERAGAYQSWGFDLNVNGDTKQAIAVTEEALRLVPDYPGALSQLAVYHGNLGHGELAGQYLERAIKAGGRGLAFWKPETVKAYAQAYNRASVATRHYDYLQALRLIDIASRDPAAARGLGSQLDTAQVGTLSNLHDIPGALRRLAAPKYVQARFGERESRNLLLSRLGTLYRAEDWSAIVANRAVFQPFIEDRGPAAQSYLQVARAYAEVGDAAQASAMLAPTPLDCDSCVSGRAIAAARTGDVAAAERWFSEAVRLAPSSALHRVNWGRARLARGDLKGALEQFKPAGKLAPKWADPLKYEGDVFLAQGKAQPAAAKYARAARMTPQWGGLYLNWGRALAAQGKAPEAAAKYRQAAALYLTPTERAELSRLQGAR